MTKKKSQEFSQEVHSCDLHHLEGLVLSNMLRVFYSFHPPVDRDGKKKKFQWKTKTFYENERWQARKLQKSVTCTVNNIHQVEAFFTICQGIPQGCQLLSKEVLFVKNFTDVIMLCNFNIFYQPPQAL